jgi:DNA-binding CsgD family transcriptional regulator/tetratricopeptide (TPR) repeat protein
MELAALRADATLVLQGQGRVAVIEGEAGIGKTRLVEEALRGSKLRIHQAVAEELSGRRPFGAIADALGIDLRAARIGRLLLSAVGSGDTVPGDLEFRVTEALLAHVEDLCAEGRVALVLEDLHWADPSTLIFLHRLARRAGELPLLVIATRRPLPELPSLDRLVQHLADRGARRLNLGPLGEGDVLALARLVLGGSPGPRLAAHLQGASGNPLFVSELLAAADRSGDLVSQPQGAIDLAADAGPSPLSVLVLHRLSLLPPETLEILRISAVLGTSFSVGDLCRVMGLSATDAARRLRPAQIGGALAAAGDRFRFRHEVIREALYHDIPEPLRRSLHLQVGRTLAETDAPAEQVAVQLLRGASPADPEVADDLRTVAAELAGRAPGLAAEALARAVEVAPSSVERDGLLAERAEALWRSGRLGEAEATCRALLSRRPDPWVRLWLIQVLIAQDRLNEATPVIEEGLATGAQPAAVHARLLAWAAWARLHAVAGPAGAEADAERAVHVAGEAGDRFARTVALITWAAAANRAGRFRQAIELSELALALDSGVAAEGEHFPLHLLSAAFLYDAGRDAEAESAVKRAFADCEERGARWELPYCHRMAALGCFLVGNWDDALVELEAAAALAEDLGIRPGTAQGYAMSAFIALHRSDFPAAMEALAAADREPMVIGPQHRRDWVLWIRGLLADASGKKDPALALVWEAWHRSSEKGNVSALPQLGPDVVRLCLHAGEFARAESVAAAVEGLVAGAGSPVVTAAALRCRGLLAGDPEALRKAARISEDAGRPFEAARAGEEAAVLMAQRGQAGEARSCLDAALRQYSALRASYDIGRVDARLRELGVRRGRQGSRGRPRHGWAALTDTERSVAALVAEGLSNPQIAERLFLSRHTVHTHVSHIFAKLGVNSRVELAREAMRQSD